MNDTKIESIQCVKDFGVTIASSLKFFQKCKDATGKANKMLSLINRNFSFKNRSNSTSVYQLSQTLYVVQFWLLHHAKDNNKTGNCQAKGYKDDYVLT